MSERLEADIAVGRLAGGERLPSIRALADALSLAPNTVAAAYRRLADRGVIVSRGRAGTFVLERPPIGVHRSPQVPPGAIDLASGGPDPRLLPDLSDYVRPSGPSTSYIDPPIVPGLIEAGTAWFERQGVRFSRLTVTSGGLDAIERVLVSHLRPGDAVAVERPGWPAITDLVAALGLRTVGVPIDETGMLPDALSAVLSSVEAIILTPRAHNPSGAALDVRRHAEIAGILDARPDVLVIEDDHAGPVAGTPLHPLTTGRRRWAFVQSVAKALGPDLRLALVAGDDLTLDRVSGRFGLGPGWVSRILQSAVTEMMSAPAVTTLLDHAGAEYSARRQAVVDALREAGVEGATGRSGLNVWTPVASEEAAVSAAAEAGFVIRGGSAFDGGGAAVRITVSNLDLAHVPPLVSAITGKGDPGRRLV